MTRSTSRRKPGKIARAIHGAKLVEETHGKQIGRVISYCIAGHHAGLHDWSGAEGAGRSSLEYQLSHVDGLDEIAKFIQDAIKTVQPTKVPEFREGAGYHCGLECCIHVWLMQIFSIRKLIWI